MRNCIKIISAPRDLLRERRSRGLGSEAFTASHFLLFPSFKVISSHIHVVDQPPHPQIVFVRLHNAHQRKFLMSMAGERADNQRKRARISTAIMPLMTWPRESIFCLTRSAFPFIGRADQRPLDSLIVFNWNLLSTSAVRSFVNIALHPHVHTNSYEQFFILFN